MAERFLLPSVRPYFDVHRESIAQDCPTGEYASDGWGEEMSSREKVIVKSIQGATEPLVWSDADVICWSLIPSDVLRELAGADIAAIDEGEGRFCCGFMFINPNRRVLKLFQTVADMKKNVEQPLVNQLAKDLEIKVKLLPSDQFTSIYHLMGGAWGGDPLEFSGKISHKVKVFHANWITGTSRKLRALEAVQSELAR